MRTTFVVLLALLIGFNGVSAQEPARAVVRHEIDQLLATLGESQCQFYRNGSWHDAERAAKHLGRKYRYLAKRDLVTTTESLIELAASKSSLTGKPYLVKCPASEAVPSKLWLTAQLALIRAQVGR